MMQFIRHFIAILGSTILLGVSIGLIDESGVIFGLPIATEDNAAKNSKSYFDFIILFNLGTFFTTICITFQQNLSSWRKYGLL